MTDQSQGYTSVSFNISANVVQQLGEELVSDEVTALLELIKNAYDADATYVSVIIDTEHFLDEPGLYYEILDATETGRQSQNRKLNNIADINQTLESSHEKHMKLKSGFITLEDDGIGMNVNDIMRGWLTISFSFKRDMQAAFALTPKRHRTPLGQKGLGRLSTQKLGNRIEMFTRREDGIKTSWDDVQGQNHQNAPYANVHVAFDWADFASNQTLSNVPVHLKEENGIKPRKGTRIVITDLHDAKVWTTPESKRRLLSQLSQLISPFEPTREFKVYLNINGNQEDLSTLSNALRDVAVSRTEFTFEDFIDKGEAKKRLRITGRVKFSRLGIDDDDDQKLLMTDAGQDFFAFLTNPTNKNRMADIQYIGKDPWFLSFSRNVDFLSLSKLEIDPVIGQIADPGSFRGEMDEFYFRGVNLGSVSDIFNRVADYRSTIKNLVGIKIYRDGFGIRPYGLNGNDWLGLGSGTTSGRSFYGMRPDNVIGYVALTGLYNIHLREKTDREGFIEDAYSRNFFLLMASTVEYLNNSIFMKLRRGFNEYKVLKAKSESSSISVSQGFVPQVKNVAERTNRLETQAKQLTERLNSTSQNIQTVLSGLQTSDVSGELRQDGIAPALHEVDDAINQAKKLLPEIAALLENIKPLEDSAKVIDARLEIFKTQLDDFSELAGLGLTAELLSHEINRIVDQLLERARTASNISRRRALTVGEVAELTQYIQSVAYALQKQINHLAPSLRYVRERKDDINIKEFFEDFRDLYLDRMVRRGIGFEVVDPNNPFSVRINRGKLTQVADNLVENAIYWVSEATKTHRLYGPVIKITIERPYFVVSDNGMGVEPSIETMLFQPFVTMKPKEVGRGLGLFITQQLLDSSGCSIRLLPDRNEFGRRYKFQVDLSGVLK